MRVVLRNPKRELDLDPAPRTVKHLLDELAVLSETVLVIRNDELVTHDAVLRATDVVELRPVVSGGSR